jgi:hypothetical protein
MAPKQLGLLWVQTAPVTEQALLAAVDASRSWYDDIFDLHRIAVGSDAALWWAEGAPPRWHSAVKTLVPTTDPSGALRRMEPHPHGTIADSFGLLDLASKGFDLLLAATWLHHRGLTATGPPVTWKRVLDSDLMATWNQHHDTVGVLPSDLWAHPRFTVLARHDGDVLTGGAILHDGGKVVGLSNTWSSDDVPVDPRELLELAAEIHPGRAVVDYAWGADLEIMLGSGFEPLGPQNVWIR